MWFGADLIGIGDGLWAKWYPPCYPWFRPWYRRKTRLQRLAAVPLEMYALLICTEPVAGCLMLRRSLACSCWGLGLPPSWCVILFPMNLRNWHAAFVQVEHADGKTSSHARSLGLKRALWNQSSPSSVIMSPWENLDLCCWMPNLHCPCWIPKEIRISSKALQKD